MKWCYVVLLTFPRGLQCRTSENTLVLYPLALWPRRLLVCKRSSPFSTGLLQSLPQLSWWLGFEVWDLHGKGSLNVCQFKPCWPMVVVLSGIDWSRLITEIHTKFNHNAWLRNGSFKMCQSTNLQSREPGEQQQEAQRPATQRSRNVLKCAGALSHGVLCIWRAKCSTCLSGDLNGLGTTCGLTCKSQQQLARRPAEHGQTLLTDLQRAQQRPVDFIIAEHWAHFDEKRSGRSPQKHTYNTHESVGLTNDWVLLTHSQEAGLGAGSVIRHSAGAGCEFGVCGGRSRGGWGWGR